MPRGPRRSTTSPSEASPDFRRDNPYETRPAAGETIRPSHGRPATGTIISPSLRDKADRRRETRSRPIGAGFFRRQTIFYREDSPRSPVSLKPAAWIRYHHRRRLPECPPRRTLHTDRSPHKSTQTERSAHPDSPRPSANTESSPHTGAVRANRHIPKHPAAHKKSRRQTASGFFIQATPDRSHPPYFAGSTAGAVAVESAGAGST